MRTLRKLNICYLKTTSHRESYVFHKHVWALHTGKYVYGPNSNTKSRSRSTTKSVSVLSPSLVIALAPVQVSFFPLPPLLHYSLKFQTIVDYITN